MESISLKINVDAISTDELYTDWYECKKCGGYNIASSFNYCPDCGILIQWEGKQEE